MTFDGFDAGMLNDVQQVAPLLLPTESGADPSLQDALTERPAATGPQPGIGHGPGEARSELGSNGFMSLRPLSTDELLLIAGNDATVTGPSPWDWDWWDPYADDPYGNGGPGGGGGETPNGGGEGENPSGSFDDRVTIDPSVPPEQLERAQQAELQLQAQMSQLDAKIQSLPDNALVTLDDKTYTGAEIKALWAGLEVVITWNNNFGPMGSAMNFNGIVKINLLDLEDRLENNGSDGEWGTDDFLIHELAHLLSADQEYLLSQWRAYERAGGILDITNWQQSSYFQNAESYTHGWGRAIGAAIGLPGYSPQSPPDNGDDDNDVPSPL